jgi:hypothetical protein
MKITIKELGKTYDVRFTYAKKISVECTDNIEFNIKNPPNPEVETPTETLCTISDIDDTKIGRDKYCLVAYGISRCNKTSGDKFVKYVGRKLAYKRAIECFSQILFASNNSDFYTEKGIRAAFWEEFNKLGAKL